MALLVQDVFHKDVFQQLFGKSPHPNSILQPHCHFKPVASSWAACGAVQEALLNMVGYYRKISIPETFSLRAMGI